MQRRSWFGEMLLFMFVGGFAVGSAWVILYCLTEYGHWWYQSSLIVSLAWNYTFTFFANKYLTYRDRDVFRLWIQIPAYLAMIYAFYEINWRVLAWLVETWGWWYMAAQILVSLLLSFASMAISPRIFRPKPLAT